MAQSNPASKFLWQEGDFTLTPRAKTGAGDQKPPANRAAEAELAAWERKVLNHLKQGRRAAACPFRAEHLPLEVRAHTMRLLAIAEDAAEVRAAFTSARTNLSPFAGTPWERKHYGHRWQVRRLQAERHDLVEPADE